MTTDFAFAADADLVSAFGPFYARATPVDTLEVLSRLLKNERAAQFLAPYEVTASVVLRTFADENSAEQEEGLVEVLVPDRWDDESSIRFSAPAAEALQRCSTDTPLGLLEAILQDPDSRAVRNLGEIGVDIAELRESLRRGEPVVREDTLEAELRPGREALLGRRRYRPVELGQFWTSFFVRVFPMNPGHVPGLWARLEAGEVAQRHGGRIRSDDLLLAILRTHALAGRYPHLVTGTREDSRAGRILSAAGLDHRRVQAAIERTDLGPDAVPLRRQLRNHPVGTTELLRRLLDQPGNRAVRLLQALDVDPAALRAGLRA